MGDTRNTDAFNMTSIRTNLPHNKIRRGLSRNYSGKSQSFACMSDIRCVEELKKKRKKYSDWQGSPSPSPSPSGVPSPCRRVSSSNQCSTMPYIDV